MRQFDQWKQRARELAMAHGGISDLDCDSLRRVLVDLHELFVSSPGSVQKAYRAMSDTRISDRCRDFANAVLGGSIAWSLPADPEQVAEVVGGLIRAVDWTLGQYRSHWPGSSSQWMMGGWYVIPRDGMRAVQSGSQSQSYQKRGLVFHRLIPSEIDGYSVEVLNARTLHLCADKTEWKMAACLFEKLELKTSRSKECGEDRFVVREVTAPSADALVASQIEQSLLEGCVALVWPELTVPPGLRERIRTLLRDRDVADDRPPPEIVVAGTWHDTTEQGVVNRAHIYDGYGEERLVYDKIAPFAVGGLGKEGIVPGTRLCVLATETALIGFAICLDFCDATSNPFTELNLDLMLVPSMGNDRTMEGHQTTAAQVEVKFGTRSFVVQHMLDSEFKDGRIGAILPMTKRPSRVPVAHLGQNAVWKSYPWPQTT
ncbi:hypothetical protein [Bradyrhizobium sp. CCBAU 53421]|uniref:hypothetical protein n=1 Tax=Bradyrhizobium sp. CCBAU 53421 TaxID=1325120 RepID=UPI00188B1F58|nr:hypothetical protein [Bradyrhizobium sp. CCBAU 53421]QOZ36342.1 hypothetical protein XH92_35715 [Bradyrhizobium sp. CCBAU 53421]